MNSKYLGLFLLISMLSVSGIRAEDRVHAVRLARGVDSVALPLSGWLMPEGEGFQSVVLSAPQRGTWDGEVYTPAPEFWEAGGDTFSLRVDSPNSLQSESATVVLVATSAQAVHTIAESFETSEGSLAGLDSEWEAFGEGDGIWLTSQAISDKWGLQIQVTGAGGEPGLRRTSWMIDGRPGGTDQVRVEAEINLDPPHSPIHHPPIEMSLITLAPRHGETLITVRFAYLGDAAFLQAALDSQAFFCGTSCETPWRQIPLGVPTRLVLWAGHEALGHPDHAQAALRFKVEPTGGWPATEDRIDDVFVPPVRRFGYGAFDIAANSSTRTGGGEVQLQLDNLVAEAGLVPELPPEPFLCDGFSSGSIDGRWIVEGPLQVTTYGPDNDFQLEVDLDQVGGLAASWATLIDRKPSQASSLTTSFLLDLQNFQQGQDERLVVFSASSSDDANPAVGRLLSIQLRDQRGILQLHGRVIDEAGVVQRTGWITVPAKQVPVMLRWQAANQQAGGKVVLWAAGQKAVLSDIANPNQRVESVCFGVQNRVGATREENVVPQTIGFDNLVSFE